LGKKRGEVSRTGLTEVVDLIRSLGCLGEIVGREFEIRDTSGKLLATISQKPIKFNQLNALIKENQKLRQDDWNNQAKMFGSIFGKKGRKKR